MQNDLLMFSKEVSNLPVTSGHFLQAPLHQPMSAISAPSTEHPRKCLEVTKIKAKK